MSGLPNLGDCVRCGRKGLPRTRDGLCFECAWADPSIPRTSGRWSRDGYREITIEWREGEAFDGRDFAALNRQLAEVPKRDNLPGRPPWPTWQQMLDAQAELRSEVPPKRGTQEQVAEKLGCSINTVKVRSGKNGGWPRG